MGFFSNLFGFLFKKKAASAAAPDKAGTQYAPAARAKTAATTATAAAPAAKAASPVPAPPAAAPTPPATLRSFSGECISVPLGQIIESLGADLKPLVAAAPDAAAQFQVPVEIVKEGLPKGAVKVSFAELKRGSPAGTFQSTTEHDEKKVSLPLKAILPHIKPEQLKTRGTKTVEVPDTIASVFAPRK